MIQINQQPIRFAVLILYLRYKDTKRRENEYILYVTAVMTKNMYKTVKNKSTYQANIKIA